MLRPKRQRGFTLLEVLVALVVVGTALGASLRAIGSLTQNSNGLSASMMATWSAENRLALVRLAGSFPELGSQTFDCPQGEMRFTCQQDVLPTPNPFFRRVEVSVFDAERPGQRILKINQLVSR